MEDGQADDPADEFEVVKVLRINTRVGINLQGVVIVRGIFEETIERIEHFVGKKEEEFTAQELAGNILEKLIIWDPYRERPP